MAMVITSVFCLLSIGMDIIRKYWFDSIILLQVLKLQIKRIEKVSFESPKPRLLTGITSSIILSNC